MERNTVENLDVFGSFEDQPFHAVKTIQFRFTFRQVGQVPARRWRRSPNPTPAVELAPSFEDAIDCSSRGDLFAAAFRHFAMDRLGSVLAQSADFLEFLANCQDHFFQLLRRSIVGRLRSQRPVRPIYAIKPLSFSPLDPAINLRLGHAKLLRDRPVRGSLSSFSNHVISLLFRTAA